MLEVVTRRSREPRCRAQERNRQCRDRDAFGESDGNAAEAVDGAQKNRSFGAVKKPTHETESKVAGEENSDESGALGKEWRKIPVFVNDGGDSFVVANRE